MLKILNRSLSFAANGISLLKNTKPPIFGNSQSIVDSARILCGCSAKNRYFSYERPSKKSKPTSDFIPLYNLKPIKFLAGFITLKNYYALTTVIATPICFLLETMEVISAESTWACLSTGVLGTAFLTFYSWRTKNFIGIIYVHKDMNTIKISYVDFWGKRIDKLIPTKEWVPLSELPHSFTSSLYLNTTVYDGSERWKLVYKRGEILDKKLFAEVIGQV